MLISATYIDLFGLNWVKRKCLVTETIKLTDVLGGTLTHTSAYWLLVQ